MLLVVGVFRQVAKVEGDIGGHRIEAADKQVEGVADQFVVGEGAALYAIFDGMADEVVPGMGAARGNDVLHVAIHCPHGVADGAKIPFVE